jgi:inorganic pyrophosphatase
MTDSKKYEELIKDLIKIKNPCKCKPPLTTRGMAEYSMEARGQLYSDSFRGYFKHNNSLISPIHDIPLTSKDGYYNMVVEVSRWSNAKVEMSTGEALNPLKQDVKKGKPRFVANVFPHHGYPWNYGAMPQTWEDPTHTDPHTGFLGDNDPLDLCDISDIRAEMGAVIQVKVLGILAMIDEGETDWKVIVVNAMDPNAPKYNDISDVESVKPGLLSATVDWFKYYKVPDGKPVNKFAFNEEFKDKQFALSVIQSTHDAWKALIGGTTSGSISLANTTQEGKVSQEEALTQLTAAPALAETPADLPANINEVFHIPSKI